MAELCYVLFIGLEQSKRAKLDQSVSCLRMCTLFQETIARCHLFFTTVNFRHPLAIVAGSGPEAVLFPGKLDEDQDNWRYFWPIVRDF